jgi:hypothetical protein
MPQQRSQATAQAILWLHVRIDRHQRSKSLAAAAIERSRTNFLWKDTFSDLSHLLNCTMMPLGHTKVEGVYT